MTKYKNQGKRTETDYHEQDKSRRKTVNLRANHNDFPTWHH